MNVTKRLLFSALLASLLGGTAVHAAEFEVMDRFSVDGYAVLRGSADIPGGSFAVGGSTFTVQYGKVGIGTTGPAYGLEVIHTAGVHLSTTVTAGYGVYLNSAANVGIGTTNPAASLDVNGEIKVGYAASACTSNIAGTLRWYDGHMSVCNGSNWRQLDNQPPPTITAVTPASGLYTLQTAITIDGSGFTSGPEVLIDGVTATNISVVSTTRITATTPAGAVGQKVLRITNPDGQYIIGAFTYNASPVITNLTPNFGLKATAITITGTGFAAGAVVKIGDIDAAGVWVSATQLTATAPSNSFINSKDVKVTNPDTGSVTLTNGFTYFAGTGGTITTPAGYRVHTFTSGGTFTANAAGNIEILAVGGGGGGGGYYYGGGGGAGGLLYNSALAVAAQGYTVTVGGGGAGGGNNTNGTNGGDSVFGSLLTAYGGGGGAYYPNDGLHGGSGGGAGGPQSASHTGGTPTSGQGYAGGNTASSSYNGYGGGAGGGGAGGAGQSISGSYVYGGNGGVGLAYSISGGSVYYAGGGGGGGGDNLTGGGGTGGTGGGGSGASASGTVATVGTANTGGGGGGGQHVGSPADSTGRAGGSGIVIVRYPN